MTQHPGQPDEPHGSGDGEQADPYASPSPDRYGSLPPAGSPTPPPYETPGRSGGPQQFGQAPYGQPAPPYGQPGPYGQSGPYGQAPAYGSGYGQQPVGTPPQNYLVWSILSTIFCCLPLGIVSIVFAAQVNSKWAAGDVAGARDSSEKAKKFAMWSALAFVILAALYLGLFTMVGLGRGFGS
jgi:Interferon-induced transmembrane protein